MNAQDDEADGNSDHQATERGDEELAGGAPGREGAGHRGGDGESIQDQRRRVVEEAFSLEDALDRSRRTQRRRAQERGDGDGIGGETIAPRVNAAAHVKAGSRECATQATATVETSTMSTASLRIGPSSRRKSRRGKEAA